MVDLDLKLSPNFRLREFLRSETAERRPELWAAQREPPEEVVANLAYLCTTVLQPVRELLDFPIHITSGYRSPALNQAVGGSEHSQHLLGQAADCTLSTRFLSDPATRNVRRKIAQRMVELTGLRPSPAVNANFLLFAYLALRRERYDLDQVIHEYGEGFGRPGWVHVAASPGADRKGEILALGSHVEGGRVAPELASALAWGCVGPVVA